MVVVSIVKFVYLNLRGTENCRHTGYTSAPATVSDGVT